MKGAASKIKYKIVFLGDQNVGKTALINRFIKNTFDQSYNVLLSCLRLLLALIFLSRTSAMDRSNTDYSFGIRQDNRDSKV